jgi:hypothetical protein
MKIKTSELSGPALRYAVALVLGRWMNSPPGAASYIYSVGKSLYTTDEHGDHQEWEPDKSWAQGGPIIEREFICADRLMNGCWLAAKRNDEGDSLLCAQHGPTPLIAAMRCYVSSRLGDEVDVPEELL